MREKIHENYFVENGRKFENVLGNFAGNKESN